MHIADIARYALLGGLVATANANRRHYRMATTWLPHLSMDAFVLLFPDIYRLLAPHLEQHAAQPGEPGEPDSTAAEGWQVVHRTFKAMVQDNPRYVLYATPLIVGYLLSHPQFNIYKGAWGEMEVAGFGFDALPHSLTAFALSMLVCDTARTGAHLAHGEHALERLLRWCHRNDEVCSALVLALVTLVWEGGEYRIYRHEMATVGNRDEINMQWSLNDTLQDCASNTLGWALAMILQQE